MIDTQQQPNVSPPVLPTKSSWFGLSTLLSVLSLLSVALASLGYGMSFAVESLFGIPHATIFASVFELIDLSSLPIVTLVSTGGDRLLDLRTLLASVPTALWILVGALFALWLVVLLLIVPAWRLPLQWLKARRPRGWFVRPRRGDSWRQILKSFAWPFAVAASLLAAAWISLLSVCALAALLSIFPLFGYTLGEAHLQRWVIDADVCTPVRTAAQRVLPQKKAADQTDATGKARRSVVTCVSLIKEGQTLITGRVVIASPSAIVVFDPATGKVRRESLGGISVQAVDF